MRKKSNVIKYIPNILTVIRFVFIPFIVLAIAFDHYIASILLFTLSSITDVCDGFIARKFNAISDFGKLMDPLADKLTQISVLASLVTVKIIPVWILSIVVLKELIMVVGASFLYGKDVVVYSKWYGKLATVLFYLAIVVSLVAEQLKLSQLWFNIDLGIFCVAIICTIFSLIMYIKCLYQGGFIDKSDLSKETKNVVVKDKWSFKKSKKD